MTAKKIKIPLGSSFEKSEHKKHLRRFFPFLTKTYRKIEKNELKKRETLTELFGADETDYTKLKAIFEYQAII